MKTLKNFKLLVGLLLVFIIALGFAPFAGDVKAGDDPTTYCYCTFWGNCKIGGGGGICYAYDPTKGGDCTAYNSNCGLFNPKR